ncbi:MAG TPA: hypothetical protein VFW00_06245 [Rhodocyclaceae bacterium]|nr:hypothetical protein [Rhodocyclaceae bacterium]
MPGKSKIKSTAKGYFHDLDPYRLHATKAGATKDRSRLLKLGGAKSRAPRVSTFYTILQDKRKNNPKKFGNVPQGPHTFPHHGIHHGIMEARRQKKLYLFKAVIPSPTQYGSRVDSEVPVGHIKRSRAELAKTIFKKRYTRFSSLMTASRSELQDIAFAHVINKLVQMDPHGSYAYKGKGAGKKALGGKGESSLLPLAQQIDLPKNSGFNDVSAVTTRSQTILKTLKGFGVI